MFTVAESYEYKETCLQLQGVMHIRKQDSVDFEQSFLLMYCCFETILTSKLICLNMYND